MDNEGVAPIFSTKLGQDRRHYNDIKKKHKNVLEINARLSPLAGGPLDVATKIRDDRTRRLEIVRKTETSPVDLEFNEAQESSLRVFRAKEEKVFKPVQSMPILKTKKDRLK